MHARAKSHGVWGSREWEERLASAQALLEGVFPDCLLVQKAAALSQRSAPQHLEPVARQVYHISLAPIAGPEKSRQLSYSNE